MQRFSEVTDSLSTPIVSIIPGLYNFNLGIGKMYVIPENPLFLSLVLPKTSVSAIFMLEFM